MDAVPDIAADDAEDGGANLMVESFGDSRSEEEFEGFPEEEISETDESDEKPNSDIEIEERDEKESDDERESTENDEEKSPDTRRCSSRNRQRKQMFTYHTMGGNPILE